MAKKFNKAAILAALAVLPMIVQAGENGTFAKAEIVGALVQEGFAETNPSGTPNEAGELQVRATQAGVAEVQKMQNDNANGAGTTEGQAAAPAGRPSFAIATVEMPKSARGGALGPRGSLYPFDDLKPGESFFVPNSAEKPNAAKSLASTVTSANARHAEVIEGQMTTNRNGKEVPATKQLREFAVRAVPDGAAWGHPGVAGAGVWRTL